MISQFNYPNRKRNMFRRGFTLLEMMIAITLSALVASAITGLVRTMLERRQVIEAQETVPLWKLLLQKQLVRDFELAKTVNISGNKIELAGYFGSDFTTHRSIMNRASVEYYVQEIEGDFWLFRKETHLDSLTNQNVRIELMGHGIGQMLLDVNRGDETALATQPANVAGNNHFRYQPLVLLDTSGVEIFRQAVRIR